MNLSILICSLNSRKSFLERILACLSTQSSLVSKRLEFNSKLNPNLRLDMIPNFEVLVDTDDAQISTGMKRNNLLFEAKGDYVCFIDDDDLVSDDYLYKILLLLWSPIPPDVIGINGIYTIDGMNPRRFVHSIKYTRWFEKDSVFYRPPNHLNPIKKDIALAVGFPDKSYKEDRAYSENLVGKLSTEVMIEEPIYFYLKRSRK